MPQLVTDHHVCQQSQRLWSLLGHCIAELSERKAYLAAPDTGSHQGVAGSTLAL